MELYHSGNEKSRGVPGGRDFSFLLSFSMARDWPAKLQVNLFQVFLVPKKPGDRPSF
jgi:hypothetical protein